MFAHASWTTNYQIIKLDKPECKSKEDGEDEESDEDDSDDESSDEEKG